MAQARQGRPRSYPEDSGAELVPHKEANAQSSV